MILPYQHYTYGFQRAEEASPPKYICADCGTGFSKIASARLHQRTYRSNCQIQSGSLQQGLPCTTTAEVKLTRVLWAKCVLGDRTSPTRWAWAECPICFDETEVMSVCANGHDICRNCLRNPSMASCPMCRQPFTARRQ